MMGVNGYVNMRYNKTYRANDINGVLRGIDGEYRGKDGDYIVIRNCIIYFTMN
jgi:hypothetical protein